VNVIPETPEFVSENNENEEFIPPDVFKRAESAANNLLPAKSQRKYEAAYAKFMQWRDKKKIKSLSETVFLAYFSELSETQVPSSVWAMYSMLRSTIQAKHNINIHNYAQLIQFLKKIQKVTK